ncbi:MAG: excinuclease ABC subunit UvrA [Holosporales bacterium]|jgi:excinuclease ABC subunit A|nr:excinuclease ABC subunit UvrA [Holosporales bacterium]
MSHGLISLRGVRVHNLKNISVDIPRNALVVLTGVSGSGKSSLAFDTLYAEGQRRYAESLSAYARQFLNLMPKPDCEAISGLSPAIAINQKGGTHNPRSTVGTVTEIYDYLRVLYTRLGTVYSPTTDSPISFMTVPQICAQLIKTHQNKRIYILAPIALDLSLPSRDILTTVKQAGFQRVRLDSHFYELEEAFFHPFTQDSILAVVIDRCCVCAEQKERLLDSLETALQWGKGRTEIYDCATETTRAYSSSEDWPGTTLSAKDITPAFFSFNNPKGACPDCKGVGRHSSFSVSLVVDPSKSLLEGAIKPWARLGQEGTRRVFKRIAERLNISLTAPFQTLSSRVQRILLEGEPGTFSGIIPHLERQWTTTESTWLREELSRYQESIICTTCHGLRLRSEALCVKVSQKSIAEVSALPIDKLHQFLHTLFFSDQHANIAEPLLRAIKERLQFLQDVGLEYLTLDRTACTLSGGESQRIHLVSRLGTGLQGVLYILDEPSIGLHKRDNDRLIRTLQHLRDLGNTVVVVEHDEDMIRAADYIVDLGPGAGQYGGNIVCKGTLHDLQQCPESLTGAYFRDEAHTAPLLTKRRVISLEKSLRLNNISTHNLQALDVAIPIGGIIGISGVSGSGKSSLILETLVPRLQKMLNKKGDKDIEGGEYFERLTTVDQTPIGRTPRSNPIVYIGGFSLIRELFASLPMAKSRGYTAKRFSFNLKGGRCEACQGEGVRRIEMHFLPPVLVQCDICQGRRYNLETLSIKFRGKSIADILDMSVIEAVDFFCNFSIISSKLKTLQQVGLTYITLGQAATTLSGGEAQRIKLAKEVSRRQNGKTLYVLDEPTTGLHFEDVKKLLSILQNLADHGNTVIVIEHNLDILKNVDWIIDLGPEGGDKGGKIIAEGPPEVIARAPHSYTGQALATALFNSQRDLSQEKSLHL